MRSLILVHEEVLHEEMLHVGASHDPPPPPPPKVPVHEDPLHEELLHWEPLHNPSPPIAPFGHEDSGVLGGFGGGDGVWGAILVLFRAIWVYLPIFEAIGGYLCEFRLF